MQLLHDGAPAHLARVTTAYLNGNNVNVVDFPPPPPQITRLKHNWKHLGWTKPLCKENRGYSDHTEWTERKNSLRVEQTPSELHLALCDVNETSLSCCNEQCGVTYPLLSLHRHGRCCRIWLKNIVIFTLFCDKFDRVWSLLVLEKCELWFNHKFEFCMRIF